MSKITWVDRLPENMRTRLAECRTIKADLDTLIRTRWGWMKEHGQGPAKGYTKMDAAIAVMELIDANGQIIDPTVEEWEALCSE